MSDYTPLPFEQSGLPEGADMRKAYALVKDIPRAVGSARILAETYPVPETIVAHMLAFVSPRLDLKEIDKNFKERSKGSEWMTGYTSQFVKDVRDIYDNNVPSPYNGASDEVRASFLVCAIYDIEKTVEEYKSLPLASQMMQTYKDGDNGMVIKMFSLEDHLREIHRRAEDNALPLSQPGLAVNGKMSTRFKEALRALELKIALPETKPAAPRKKKAGPKGPGM